MRNSQIYIDSIFAGLAKLWGDAIAQNDKFSSSEPASEPYISQATRYLGIGELEKSPEQYLVNIFEKIYPPKGDQAPRKFKLKALSLEKEDLFPSDAPTGDLDAILQGLSDEYQKIPEGSLETLYYLLKKHLSFVPVNAQVPYVNAFEFLKLRSAFAQCLYDFDQGKENPSEDLQFLMLCVDISGIQKFIYDIVLNKAAKSLKGRSFYLQLLMDSLIQRVFHDTQDVGVNTSLGHTIYASGGKAYLLLPNLPSVRQCIIDLEQQVEKQIYEEHAHSLYVLMDWVAFGYDAQAQLKVSVDALELIKAKKDEPNAPLEIADLWTFLSEKSAQKKQRKYRQMLTKNFDDFFGETKKGLHEGIDIGYDFDDKKIKTCSVTGSVIKSPYRERHVLNTDDGEDDWVWVLESVKKQVNLGLQLKNTEFYVTYQGAKELTDKAKYYTINPVELGVPNYLKNKDHFIDEYDKVGSFKSLQYSLLRHFNDLDFLNTIKEKETSHGFTFYGGNKQALKVNKEGKKVEKDYSDLADFNETTEGKGFHRLGILRMDVDGLGGLFADDMQAKFGRESLQSFPAYAMVSAQLDTFYAGYLNTLRNQDKYKDWVNILYSGGDDVFAVGRWDLVLEFAHDIQQQFKDYVGERPTLSAGVALITSKFPISKGADMAGEAESSAKKFGEDKAKGIEPTKNAIEFLGEVVGWHEFAKVKTIRDQLIEFDGIISASFRQKLIRFQAIKNKHVVARGFNASPDLAPDLSYKWQSAYFIAQLAKELKGKKDKHRAHATLLTFAEDLHPAEQNYLKTLNKKKVHYDREALNKFLNQAQQDLFVADRNFDLYALAARWAGLLLRSKNRQEN